MKPFDILSEKTRDILIQLENRDTKERKDGVPQSKRLRQIPRVTGEFLFQFLSVFSQGRQNLKGIEIGSSGGYSTLWQGLALKSTANGHLTTFDVDPVKIELAQKNVNETQLESYVTVVHQDALEYINTSENKSISYVFLDAEKEDYINFFKALLPKMEKGAVLIADNIISHNEYLQSFVDFASEQENLLVNVLTIGKGLAFIRWT